MDYEAENISCLVVGNLRFSDKDPIILRALTAVLAHTGQIRNWQLFFCIDKIGRPHAQHKNNIGHFNGFFWNASKKRRVKKNIKKIFWCSFPKILMARLLWNNSLRSSNFNDFINVLGTFDYCRKIFEDGTNYSCASGQ